MSYLKKWQQFITEQEDNTPSTADPATHDDGKTGSMDSPEANPLAYIKGQIVVLHNLLMNDDIDGYFDTVNDEKLFRALEDLDLALTGKHDNKVLKHEQAYKELAEGPLHIFYLSDGGYSRVVLNPTNGKVHLTHNSTDLVKQKYKELEEEL